MPRLSRALVLRTLREQHETLERMGVLRIGVFGSVARRSATAESDLDVLVKLARPTFDSYMDVKFLLEDLFGCKVDLVEESALRHEFESVREETVYA
jgi:predicted nucleotidyltransferase